MLLIDHSVQIGTVKVCDCIACAMFRYPQRALRYEDMHVIAVIPVEQSTGEIVDAQLEQATRDGIPGKSSAIARFSDVKKGAALFARHHPDAAVTYDAAHHGAIVIKRRFEQTHSGRNTSAV